MKKLLIITLLAWTIVTPLSAMNSEEEEIFSEEDLISNYIDQLERASTSYPAFNGEAKTHNFHYRENYGDLTYCKALELLISRLQKKFPTVVATLFSNEPSRHLLCFFQETYHFLLFKYIRSSPSKHLVQKICEQFLESKTDGEQRNWLAKMTVHSIEWTLDTYFPKSKKNSGFEDIVTARIMMMQSLTANLRYCPYIISWNEEEEEENSRSVSSDSYMDYLHQGDKSLKKLYEALTQDIITVFAKMSKESGSKDRIIEEEEEEEGETTIATCMDNFFSGAQNRFTMDNYRDNYKDMVQKSIQAIIFHDKIAANNLKIFLRACEQIKNPNPEESKNEPISENDGLIGIFYYIDSKTQAIEKLVVRFPVLKLIEPANDLLKLHTPLC